MAASIFGLTLHGIYQNVHFRRLIILIIVITTINDDNNVTILSIYIYLTKAKARTYTLTNFINQTPFVCSSMAGASLVSSSSSCSSNVSLIPTRPQVFINFRGKELRKGFISFLVPALKDKNINVFIDDQEERGKYLTSLFDRIGESKIALVIFSEDYTESKWCLDELVQIKECMDQNKLRVIPIFYKLDPAVVKRLQGKFGDQFRDLEYRYKHKPERPQKWKEAVISVCQTFALFLPEHRFLFFHFYVLIT